MMKIPDHYRKYLQITDEIRKTRDQIKRMESLVIQMHSKHLKDLEALLEDLITEEREGE